MSYIDPRGIIESGSRKARSDSRKLLFLPDKKLLSLIEDSQNKFRRLLKVHYGSLSGITISGILTGCLNKYLLNESTSSSMGLAIFISFIEIGSYLTLLAPKIMSDISYNYQLRDYARKEYKSRLEKGLVQELSN